MKPGSIAIVGAAETERLGKIPDMSEIELHADAALRALDDAGLKPSDIDGVAAISEYAAQVAYYLGISPCWVDGTNVGGCSFMLMVRHAAAAITAGLCETVLITHGESGRSRVGALPWAVHAHSLHGQFEMPFGAIDPPTQFNVPFLRYMQRYGLSEETLATIPVIQREWAAKNPRAYARDPLTVDEVLDSRMIAYPFRKLMCCLVTDGGGALILTSAERAPDRPSRPVYLLGTGEGVETLLTGQIADLTSGKAYRIAAAKAFGEAGIERSDVDHLMIYDAFAATTHLGVRGSRFCGAGVRLAISIAARRTAPGGTLPMNTNGGGLSYTHTGMYGMFALQESVRQLRGVAPAQIENVQISLAHGVGNRFEAGGTIIMTNQS